jgi:hypothetical protein
MTAQHRHSAQGDQKWLAPVRAIKDPHVLAYFRDQVGGAFSGATQSLSLEGSRLDALADTLAGVVRGRYVYATESCPSVPEHPTRTEARVT